MSPVLRIVILAVIGVALFFVGLVAGLMSDSYVWDSFESAPVVSEAPEPMEPRWPRRIIRVPVPVEVPVRVPVPFAVADEQIGAYRVNGYVVIHGPSRFGTHRSKMACFPLEG